MSIIELISYCFNMEGFYYEKKQAELLYEIQKDFE